jgi:hypothetical protein
VKILKHKVWRLKEAGAFPLSEHTSWPPQEKLFIWSTFVKCRTDNHDGVWRLLPQRAGALTDIALLRLSGGWLSASELHCFETASSVLRVKALNFNWSRTSTVGTVDSLCITRIAPLDTTWCTASGSPIEPEGLPCTSHWVLLCTRLLIMDSVLSSLETLVLCACQ